MADATLPVDAALTTVTCPTRRTQMDTGDFGWEGDKSPVGHATHR
jgi:hypothetical protein